jgi:transposase-like protein|tara:strand:+ start:201 stop:728 length:528 start_codon:yes stop_codon:yes gene_type:complete
MYKADWKTVSIAKELGVHPGTVRRWFKKLGVRAKKNGLHPHEAPPEETSDKLADAIDHQLEATTDEAILRAGHDARQEEDTAILEIAERQSSPADKYQHYAAATGIKLMRDSVKNLRPAKSVRELSELDQFIRRNLGLNSKNGSASKMQIDISILNNTKADRGEGAVKPIIDLTP